MSEQTKTPLETAYEKIEQLPDYAEKLDTMGTDIGRIQGIIWPNSKFRDEVIAIINEIPGNLLYYDAGSNDRIHRYYLYVNKDGKEQVLYVVVGHGGNDLMAELVTDSKTELNKDIIDKLISIRKENK